MLISNSEYERVNADSEQSKEIKEAIKEFREADR
jgi:hypothetical protein